MEMELKTLTKFLMRDMSLIAVECWYRGRADFFHRFFHIPFPTSAFIHRNGAFEFYTDLKGFEYNLPKELAQWIDKKGNELNKVHKFMVEGLSFFNKIRNVESSTVKELLDDLDKTIELFTQGFVGVLVAHHVPLFHSNFVKNGEKLFDEKIIDKIIKWREEEGNIFFNEGVNTIYFLLEKIGNIKEWDKNLLKYVTFKELSKSINSNKDLPIEQLKKRKKSVFIYFDYKVIYEPDIEVKMRENGYQLKREQLSKDLNKIEGNIANRGFAKGKIKIVFNRQQLDKVKEGDVLVAPMTCVWYVPATKKAAAIVTDEGGITCHATIISRELNKPCVIGTKIATELLKDGDFVEVDANKGIVKKITKGEFDKVSDN